MQTQTVRKSKQQHLTIASNCQFECYCMRNMTQ